MLVAPQALHISKAFDLPRGHAQALVDLETTCADLGLVIAILCKACHQVGDRATCDGDTEAHDDGSMTFSVLCRCTRRSFRGGLRAPSPPRPLRDPRVDLTVRPEQALSKAQMAVFQDAADALHQLRLAFAMRCLACRMENRQTDGVWGSKDTTASQYVLECACTKRIYRGSDVKLT